MNSKHLIFYVAIGFGLLVLLTAVEVYEPDLASMARVPVFGYWATLGIGVLLSLLRNLFSAFSFSMMLYQLWLFCSLMCVAIGILAIMDDWPNRNAWAIWIIIYGITVGYLNRKEL